MTATETIETLQARQAEIYAQAEAAVQAERAQYPDCQTWSQPLNPPDNEFDPTPAEQQAFADQYRAEHIDADQRTRSGMTRSQPQGYLSTPVATALGEWRKEQAQARFADMIRRRIEPPPCQVCGVSSQNRTLWVGGRTRPVCRRCQPSVIAAQAQAVAREKLPDGRTRSQAAAELVSSTIDKATVT